MLKPSFTAAHTYCSVGRLSGRLFYGCHLFNILFRQPNPSRPATDLAEIWHADRKLLLFMNAGPQWGLKTEKFRTVPTVRSL